MQDLGKNGLRLQFQGKSHHDWDVHVTDPKLVAAIREHAEGKTGAQPLFGVSPQAVNDYLERSSPMKVTAKDFRTFHANRLLVTKLAELPEPCRRRPFGGAARSHRSGRPERVPQPALRAPPRG